MIKPAIPSDEAQRLATLASLNILDTPPEERFDIITRLAQRTFGVPIALVSLVDANRQWFKSCQGLDATETPRDISFCGYAILGDDAFVISDALLDPRFADNPLVAGEPHIRFYAGQPLKANNGSKLGTLCVIDRKPRQLSPADLENLRDLGKLVENEFKHLDIRAANIAIQDNENRLRAILDNVLDGIITINESGIVETFNKSSEKIFGYAAAEVVGNNVSMLMPEPYHSAHDGYLHNFVSTGVKKIIGIGREVVGLRKDGTTFPMDLAVSEMFIGNNRLFTGIVRDITERVKIERMKNEFVSTVSHELRTPLTSIRGSLGLLAGGVGGELSAQARGLIDIAHKNCERLILLVNDILDMEKIESGKMEFKSSPTELMPLLKQAIESNNAYAAQLNVSYQLGNELPGVMVNVDVNRLMQVLANLLSNAAKFSPPGDKVIIGATSNGHYARVEVSDHGEGIPEQFRSQIFGKFAQADLSDTRKKGGTGLGLSITKAIVERMGGRIGFMSEPNVLTTFFVEFPVWKGAPDVVPDSMVATGEKRILICEDDPDIATLLRLILKEGGLASDIAYNAIQAKKMLAQNSYAAMTLDLALPDQDGISLIRELRMTKQTANFPIVVVSAKAIDGRKELNGDAFNVVDWISKPIDREQLVEALTQAVIRSSDARHRVLHVEDDADIFRIVSAIVGEFAELDNATCLADARRLLEVNHYDLVILDISLPDGSGMELLPTLNHAVPPIPVMVFSASEMESGKMQEIRSVLVKSRTDNAHLLATIKRLLDIE